MEVSVLEIVSMWKDLVSLSGMRHVFLDPKIGDGDIKVQRRSHCDRREIGGSVAAGLDVIHIGKGRDLLERGDATAVDHGHAEIIDELLGDKSVGVPNRVEDLTGGERR